jgi:ABC-type Fe3+/spermidine/putrescine transport system ATPase subunit
MSLLTISDVSRKYPATAFHAIDGVSAEIHKGEVIAIVGENGSGKTTLLKLINGMEDADRGEIIFNGNKITGPSFNLVPGHEQIKMLFQEFNLLPHHTVKENILQNLRYFQQKAQDEKLAELLKLCRLDGFEDKYPRALSGGQQQRVALARALADNPLLLLMDEPFSNLDVMLKDEIRRAVVRTIRKQGNSIIFVTHEMKDALSLSDKILVLRDGKIVQFDTPKNIYEKPSDEYVAYLFGNVNIISSKDFLKSFKALSDHLKFKNAASKTKICIRPEHIVLCKEEKSMSKGKVKHISYLGDSFELEVETNGLILRINTRKKNIVEGETIFFKINVGRVHVIKAYVIK